MGFTRYIVEENNFRPESNYPILDNFFYILSVDEF